MKTNKMYVGISLKIAKVDADYDYQKWISKKTLVNTLQLEQIKEYITEHTHDYQIKLNILPRLIQNLVFKTINY